MMNFRTYRIRRSFNNQVRMRTWQKLAMQEKVGVDPIEGVKILMRQAVEQKRPEVHLYARILKGTTQQFAASLVGYVTSEEVSLISSAEKSGNIGEGFTLAHQFLQHNEHLSRVIKKAIREPLLSTFALFLLIVATARLVIPNLAMLYPPSKWTGLAAVLYSITQYIDSFFGYIAVSLIPLSIIALFVSMPLWTGPLRQRVDGIGPWAIYRSIVGLSWLYSVATLLRSNIDISQIFSNMSNDKSCTPYLKEKLESIQRQFQFGIGFGEALKRSKTNFPSPELVADIEIYSRLPNLRTSLYTIATEQMRFDSIAIEEKMKLYNAILKTCIWIILGFIVIAGYDIESQMAQFS